MNFSEKVSNIMSTDLTSIHDDTPVGKFKNLFERRGIHHVLVEDKAGNLEGIISTEDFLRTTHFPVKEERLLARHIMTASPVSVTPDTRVGEVIDVFLNNYFRSVPVADKNGVLVGIVTPYDILAMLSQKMEA